MFKYIAISILLLGIIACGEDRHFDCTKADKNAMLEYLKICYLKTESRKCQELVKEIHCKEFFPKETQKDSLDDIDWMIPVP